MDGFSITTYHRYTPYLGSYDGDGGQWERTVCEVSSHTHSSQRTSSNQKRVDMVDKKVPELEKEIKRAGDNAKSAQSLAQTMSKDLKEKSRYRT